MHSFLEYSPPCPFALTPAHSLDWYRFIGRILGKALYEGILVEVAFAGFFLAKVRCLVDGFLTNKVDLQLSQWLGKQSFLDDLASLDPDLYQGLVFLKNYTGNMEDLSLNFTVANEGGSCMLPILFISSTPGTFDIEFGVAKTIDLIHDGSNVPITRENRLQYIYLVSHYKLSKQIKLQSEAFFEGLSEMIDPKWLRYVSEKSYLKAGGRRDC